MRSPVPAGTDTNHESAKNSLTVGRSRGSIPHRPIQESPVAFSLSQQVISEVRIARSTLGQLGLINIGNIRIQPLRQHTADQSGSILIISNPFIRY